MVDIFSLEVQSALSNLTDEQKLIFESTFNKNKKNKSIYLILAIIFPIQLLLFGKFLTWLLFIGTVGGMFLWYFFEIYYTPKRVDNFNNELALRIINQIEMEIGLTENESESESNEKVLKLDSTMTKDKKWTIAAGWIIAAIVGILYVIYSDDPNVVEVRKDITGKVQESIGLDCESASMPTEEEIALINKELDAQCESDLYFRKIKGLWYTGLPGQFCYSISDVFPNYGMLELTLLPHVDIFVADGWVLWKDVVDKMNIIDGVMSTCSFMQ